MAIKHSRANERDRRYNKGSYFVSKTDDAKHDELVERALMKKKMAARRFAELLLDVGELDKL
jgi:hypothetical protein